jgi:hypothetical protein
VRGTILNRDTLVPLGLVGSVVVAAVLIVTTMNNMRTDMEIANQKFEARLEAIEKDAKSAADAVNRITFLDDRWTSKDMRHWVELLAAKNPEIDVPGADSE